MADSTAQTPTAVNAQVIDSVSNNTFNVVGTSPAQAMSMLYQSAASTAGLAIQSGQQQQQQLAQIGQSVTSVGAKLIMDLAK